MHTLEHLDVFSKGSSGQSNTSQGTTIKIWQHHVTNKFAAAVPLASTAESTTDTIDEHDEEDEEDEHDEADALSPTTTITAMLAKMDLEPAAFLRDQLTAFSVDAAASSSSQISLRWKDDWSLSDDVPNSRAEEKDDPYFRHVIRMPFLSFDEPMSLLQRLTATINLEQVVKHVARHLQATPPETFNLSSLEDWIKEEAGQSDPSFPMTQMHEMVKFVTIFLFWVHP